MSARYKPVGWNPSKIVYDAVLLAAILLYATVFHVTSRRASSI